MRWNPFFTVLLAALASMPGFAAAGERLKPDLAGLGSLPQITLPAAPVQKTLQAAVPGKGRPLQFAVRIPVQLDLSDGQWDQVNPETARWRLKLHSPGAVSLHLHFDALHLPDGAELWFYDSAGQLVQGPLTRAHEDAAGGVATALVLGETAALELRVARQLRDQVSLQVSEAFHGVRDFRRAKAGLTSNAGPCEKDVACPEGNGWQNPIRSVVLLQLAGGLCSGQLINNSSGDETPYVLTANHCDIGPGNAGQVNAYFNVQSSSCGGNDGNLNQVVNGATFQAANVDADTTLIRLNSQPPLAFNAYYTGWDASPSGGDIASGAGIHHPQGDEKSISLFNTTPVKVNDACFQENFSGQCVARSDGWEVEWARGATEVGSSGSGLWNNSRRLIGVLSGGASDCAGPNDNGLTDIYGRLEVAFGSNVLRQKLDPAGGTLALDGRSATQAGGPPGTPDPGGSAGGSTGGLFAGGGGSGGGGSGLLLPLALLALWLLRARR